MNKELVSLLRARGLTFSAAESCTAGLVCDRVASVSGASAVLRGGAVCYVDEIKTALLGVSSELLHRRSAVCAEVALQMAEGCARLFGTDCAVSTTGLAGPPSADDPAPVGTVYIGVLTPYGTQVHHCLFEGDRRGVREQAADTATKLLYECIITQSEEHKK